MSVTANPITEGVLMSNAPNLFTVQDTANSGNSQYRLVCKVFIGADSILTMSRIPNSAGVAHFELREVLRQTAAQQLALRAIGNDECSLHYMPAGDYGSRENSISRNNVKGNMSVKFSETYINSSGVNVDNSIDNFEFTLLHGAIQFPDLKWNAIDYKVYGAIDDLRLALPLNIRSQYKIPVKESDNGVISFFMDDGTTTIGAFFKLRIEYFNKANNSLGVMTIDRPAEFIVANPSFAIQHFGVYPDNLNRNGSTAITIKPNDVPTWSYYTFKLLDRATDEPITKTLTFIKECKSSYENIRLGFANNLCGWEYVNFDLRHKEEIQVEVSESTKLPGTYDEAVFKYNSHDRGLSVDNSESRQRLTVSTDIDISESKLIKNLISSRDVVWLKELNAPVAVRIRDRQVRVKKSGDRDYTNLTIQIEVAQKIYSA